MQLKSTSVYQHLKWWFPYTLAYVEEIRFIPTVLSATQIIKCLSVSMMVPHAEEIKATKDDFINQPNTIAQRSMDSYPGHGICN